MTARKLTAILFCVVLAATVLPVGAGEPDQDAMAAAWAESAAPGPVHALFADLAGDWTVVSTSWMAPGADPIVSESVSHAEMILGGRFLSEQIVGTAMGQAFEGRGQTGYNNSTHLVTSIWIDTLGTVTVVMTGIYEKPGEPMELFGEMVDPASGTTMKIRTVTMFNTDGTHHMDYYMTMAGMDEMKAMELSYTRK